MMELTCAFILILASLVSATPYGYGVKGGAAARAESSASAGAFGGVAEVPVAVPLGIGHSGSFSKSSSSSSSSSSASSSSSSSSFSYSGSGAGGLSGFGLTGGSQGNAGCSSGNCQIAGAHGIPASNEHSLQGYNTANSAAKAGADGLSGSGCQGLNCDNNYEKCASGQCKTGTQTAPHPSTDSDTNKCKLGQCGSNLQSGVSPSEYGSNDIRVVPDSLASGPDSKDQSQDGAGTDCSRGKCGSSGPPKSNYGHDSKNSYQSSSASDKQQTSNSNAGINSHYNTPATHLETPKLGSKCSSGNCQAEPGHETSPSSYNVPIHSSYDSEKKPACDGVKCENQPKGIYSSTNSNSPSADDNPSITNCQGSNCIGLPSSQVTGGPSLSVGPGQVNFGQSPNKTPTLSLTNCKTPNCSPSSAYPGITAAYTPPRHIDYAKPSDGIKPSNDKLPAYTGGFGGPAGLLKPTEFDAANPTGHPSHVHSSPSQNGAPLGTSPPSCNSPSCAGYPSGSETNAQPQHPGVHGSRPGSGVNIPSEKLPTYTGGFAGPAGMLKPNEFDVPAFTTAPNHSHPASSPDNIQPPLINIGTTGCKTANCGAYSPTAGATAQPGHFGNSKPSIGVGSPSEKLPGYTGGFGGPGGVYKPNEYDTHATGPSSPSFPSTAVANAQAESLSVTKPSSSSHPSTSTAYTGNYGIPSGVNKPNEISTPPHVPSFVNIQSPSASNSYSTGCKTANCAVYPTSGALAGTNAQPGYFGITKPNTVANPSGPSPTGSFSGPTGSSKPYGHSTPIGTPSLNCKTPNCANPSTSSGGLTLGANAQSGSYAITKPSSDINNSNQQLPTYTGGFSGTSGFLKPNEHKDSAVSPTLHDYNNPITAPTGPSKPVACTSGNCNPQVPHDSETHQHNAASNVAQATAAAAADANAVAYTGGFGGPPGVFKPYDEGKIGAKPTNGGHAPGSQIGAHSSPNTNGHSPYPMIPGAINGPTGTSGLTENTALQAGSITGSAAYAGAAAGTFSGAHGYNTHGSHYDHLTNINGGSPCGSSCGGTSGGGYNGGFSFDSNGGYDLTKPGYSGGLNGGRSTAGATAKSLAGAGAFGLGGSFASSSATAHASAGAYTKGGYGK